MSIIDHIEKYLGKIDQGWKDDSSEQKIQIVSFKDCPGEDATTFVSLGVSEKVLNLAGDKKVRQEIIFSIYSITVSNLIVSLLLSLCESILDRDQALLRGEVIPLSENISTRIGFEAVYCVIPVFFEDEFSTFNGSSPSTVIVWMLPIHKSEAKFIEVNGWEVFEDLLVENDPDLCALDRSPVV